MVSVVVACRCNKKKIKSALEEEIHSARKLA